MSDSSEPPNLYIGLMSGTSMDGIDAVLANFEKHSCNILASRATHYPAALRVALLEASRQPEECTVDKIGELDQWVGECFRDAAKALLVDSDSDPARVRAIGSHGQTIRHQPRAKRPFTLQIGDPSIIVTGTGVTTVADFRRRDIAVGGEGAPLAPAFHRWLFGSEDNNRCVLNVGGIANLTILTAGAEPTIGFDTGPGNTLLDSWARANLNTAYDNNGEWAASGNVSRILLAEMLSDEYFAEPPPKSTGFEYFDHNWIVTRLAAIGNPALHAADIQATLAELSAQTIANAIVQTDLPFADLLVCGGGVYNKDFMQRLRRLLPRTCVSETGAHGLPADWVEAAAFAWLAKRCIEGEPGNLPSVTGADSLEVLGAIYPGNS